MRILAVIPARGGSKGIPRKNLRLMNGRPLIVYTIENAKKSKYITDVFVSTDSLEIADIALQYGAKIIHRDSSLAGDTVTLDPVIYDALLQAELSQGCCYDVVITLQPTSPLLRNETLDGAIEAFFFQGCDTLISVINRPHLGWGEKEGHIFPLYSVRKNRQELPPHYIETGAFVINKRDVVARDSRIGKKVSVWEISAKEGIDIDEREDWVLSESLMRTKRILFRADGYPQLGLGHIYNCLTLAFSMLEHEILLVTKESASIGLAKIRESGIPYRTIQEDDEIYRIIDDFMPDIWVNDCLDTSAEYILALKGRVGRVITIEDLGSGASKADAVINALYDDHLEGNVYSGYRYVCLRDEFHVERGKDFSPDVKNVMIMFGGTDPANLNKIVYKQLLKAHAHFGDVQFHFITGLGYDFEGNGVITQRDKSIWVHPDVPRVTKYMKDADLAITSQGRTIFELAAMGVPSIVLSQNEREMTHSFAQMKHGFLNLGLGQHVDPELIQQTLLWLLHAPSVRRNMRDLMLAFPLRTGLQRVKRIILGEYDD